MSEQLELSGIPEAPKKIESLLDSMVETSENSTDLVAQSSEVAEEPTMLGAFSGGKVNFDSQDLIFPRIRLAQALTAEVTEGTAKAGQYVLTGMEPLDQITVVPGLFARRRMYASSETQDVLCRSSDSLIGTGAPGGECDKCPFSKWTGTSEEHNRKQPICTFMYSYIVFVVELEQIGIVDFRKTSLQAGKVVNTLASRYGLLNFAFTLKAISQTNLQKQRFHIMSVVPAKVDAATLSTAAQFFNM